MIMCIAALIILFLSIILKRDPWIPAIVATEFLASNSAVEALINMGKEGGMIFYLNYTFASLISLAVAACVAIYCLTSKPSKSYALVAVLYFIYGLFGFFVIIESLPLGGSYPFEIIGIYSNIEVINNTFCALILGATGYGAVGKHGTGVRNNIRFSGANISRS